jgi:suppressor for copper-sensitivity B
MWWNKAATSGLYVVTLLLVLAALLTSVRAIAADWTEREFAKFRLVPDSSAINGSTEVLMGLEIDLETGWHFYSKDAGEFGVAPKFDWTASRNLVSAMIYWPEPTRIVYSTDPPVSVLGYNEALLLPIVLETRSTSDDLDVRLTLEYALCSDFCVMDTVKLGLMLPAGEGRTTPYSSRLERALANANAATR